eukprot:7356203-Pyramimonas_sp.AAC.1
MHPVREHVSQRRRHPGACSRRQGIHDGASTTDRFRTLLAAHVFKTQTEQTAVEMINLIEDRIN